MARAFTLSKVGNRYGDGLAAVHVSREVGLGAKVVPVPGDTQRDGDPVQASAK